MRPAGFTRPLCCGAATLSLALAAVGCSSAPVTGGSANTAAEPSVSGSLTEWRDSVCRDGTETDSGTSHIVDGSTCVPQDGDGVVNFDHFESASSMDSMLSWAASPYVAKTVVDGRPLAIWTPSGEASDLDPLKRYGFDVVSYQSAALARSTADLPAAVPPAGVETIPPNRYGYVAVQTASGDIRCMIETTYVGCETGEMSWPQHADGSGPYHGVRINPDGTGSWVDGNLGTPPTTTLAERTYRAEGWTIVASPSGLRFTNDETGHGAVVSVRMVQPF
ncbi:hypothetical protein JDV09_21320 [Mycobacterium sp. Y57]|uniref:hypothetical protein n=1 Tax=Mycolicibacterium xanthum TaxID=2796469 RepID=UPI001C85ADC8|nr:hypothetical protein [Mycolicibacterium xanthum]MBX7434616.1 hypothetical protein [Mycolicibacterium xanthum]